MIATLRLQEPRPLPAAGPVWFVSLVAYLFVEPIPLPACSVSCHLQDMPRDEFTAEAFFKGFAEGWTAAGGDATVGSCPVPEPHFEEVEYLIDQVGDCTKCRCCGPACLSSKMENCLKR